MENNKILAVCMSLLVAGIVGVALAQERNKEKNPFYTSARPIEEYTPGIDYVSGEVIVVIPVTSKLLQGGRDVRQRIADLAAKSDPSFNIMQITKLAATKGETSRVCGGLAIRLRSSQARRLSDTILQNLNDQLGTDSDLGDFTESGNEANGRPSLPPTDPSLTGTSMSRAQAPKFDHDASGMAVAVIDSGVEKVLPGINLASQIRFFNGFKIADTFNDNFIFPFAAKPWMGHGTQVAGIIAGKPTSTAGTGIAQNAKILPVQACKDNRSCTGLDVLSSICYAASSENELERPADVINISLGGYIGSRTIENAILDARDAGSVIVMAAGNSRNKFWNIPVNVKPEDYARIVEDRKRFLNDPVYPAAFSSGFSSDSDGLISVGSVAKNEIGAALSDFSTWNQNVDFVAPGENLDLYRPNGISDADHSGTSFSAPFVSALAAIIKHTDPTMSPADVEDVLRSDDIPGDTVTLDCTTPATPTPGCGSLVAPTALEVKQLKF
jgi:subtilisin family serine protease